MYESYYDILIEIFRRLERPNITFDMSLIGHRDYIIGARSSSLSDPNVFDFLHEVAHLVQLSDDEIKSKYVIHGGKLNFFYPQAELNGFIYNDPQTDKMSMRELEVFCIQYMLEMKLLNKKTSFISWLEANDIEDLFTWIPDDIHFGYKIKNDEIEIKAKHFLEIWNVEKILDRWFNINFGD